MNTLSLAAFPALAAALLSTQNPEPAAPAIDEEVAPLFVERQFPLAETALVGAGLGPHRGLQTGKLQMGTGLQSGARGLTPENEWRALFPVKPGTR